MEDLQYPFAGLPEAGAALELAPGVKWVRMPMPMELDHINLYLLLDGDGWFIVDTGLAGDQTRQLWQRIFDTELDGKPIKGVIATHLHPDHIGQVGWLTETWQVSLWMTQGEYLSARLFSGHDNPGGTSAFAQFYQRAGMAPAAVAKIQEEIGSFNRMVEPLPSSYRRIQQDEELRIGDYQWHVTVAQGHSPEHACLYCAELGMLISGDQVLPEITPNVGVNCVEPEANPLEAWLESLSRLQALPSDTLVLPAHNRPFVGLQQRLMDVIDHHDEQLEVLLQACQTPRSAVELLPVLFKRKLKSSDMLLGLGECIAHLNCLIKRNQIDRFLVDGQVHHYRSRC